MREIKIFGRDVWWYCSKDNSLRCGRAWLHVGRSCFQFEWNFWSKFCHVYIIVGGEENDFMFGIAFPPVAFWFGAESLLPYDKLPRDGGREIGISIHHGIIWFKIWQNTMKWDTKDRWRYFSFNFIDFFFGKQKFSKKVLKKEHVEIPMYEGIYTGVAKLYEVIWKRSRWPFERRILRVDIKLDEPIPVPGKGENFWDCGEDGIYEISVPAKTIQEGIASLVRSCLETREKYGGKSWRPAKVVNV